MAVCSPFAHRAEGMSVQEGIAFEGCPGRGETQNSSNIFRKTPAHGLTTPENQQAELDRLILQLQELSKHVAMQQLYRLNGLLGGWDERGAGLVSPGAVVSLLATAMLAARELLSAERLATDVVYLLSFPCRSLPHPLAICTLSDCKGHKSRHGKTSWI